MGRIQDPGDPAHYGKLIIMSAVIETATLGPGTEYVYAHLEEQVL